MATRAELRIGDADREAGAASLREHFAEGRLTLEEFNERLDAMFAARTQGQLDEITGDLPHVRTPSVPLPVPSGRNAAGGRDGQGDVDAQSRMGMVAGLVAVLAVWFFLLVPALATSRFFELPGRFPLLLIGLLIIRALTRRIFGGRSRWDGGGRGDWYDGRGQSRNVPGRYEHGGYEHGRYQHGQYEHGQYEHGQHEHGQHEHGQHAHGGQGYRDRA